MKINHCKIDNAEDLLKRFFLNCDERPLLFLQGVAENAAIDAAENKKWIKKENRDKDKVVYRLTKYGRIFLE